MTEASIWVKIGFPLKKIAYEQFRIKNGKILLIPNCASTIVPKNTFFGCTLILIPDIIFDL